MSATTITQLAPIVRELLTTEADQIARATGFVKRLRKLSGASFAQALVFSFMLDAHPTFRQQAQTAAASGACVTPSALQQRYTLQQKQTAVTFMRRLLERAIEQGVQIQAEPALIPILQRFTHVYVQDSSWVSLPDSLSAEWPSGHDHAALKLQVRLDYLTGQVQLALEAGHTSDQHLPDAQRSCERGALCLRDLGYFKVRALQQLEQDGVYWLTHIRHNTAIFTVPAAPVAAPAQRWSLLDLLQHYERAGQTAQGLELAVQLGVDVRLPCRLFARRVPRQVASELQRRLYAHARDKGETVSAAQVALTRWVVFVSNVPSDLLSLAEALVVARVRWQIELLFKLWKSYGAIDECHSANADIILCELYAKLLALLIQHWVFIVGLWRFPDRSLFKAADTLRAHALSLVTALSSAERLCDALAALVRSLSIGCRIDKRGKAPATWQLLLALTETPP